MKAIVLLLAIILTGCASAPTPDVIRDPITVKVPVPTWEAPPEALLQCGKIKPTFRFYNRNEHSNDIVILERDQPAFRRWIEDRNRCLEAWRAWGTR